MLVINRMKNKILITSYWTALTTIKKKFKF